MTDCPTGSEESTGVILSRKPIHRNRCVGLELLLLLGESNYVKLLRFVCDVDSNAERSRSRELNQRFLGLDTVVQKTYQPATLEWAQPCLHNTELEWINTARFRLRGCLLQECHI